VVLTIETWSYLLEERTGIFVPSLLRDAYNLQVFFLLYVGLVHLDYIAKANTSLVLKLAKYPVLNLRIDLDCIY